MESYGMVKTRVKLHTRHGVPTHHPAAWESLTDLCNDVYQRINSVIPNKRHVVIYLGFRGSKYRLKLDFNNINAKAATVVCVIGLGFGLGSYLLYKLYCKFIRCDVKKKPKLKPRKSDLPDENYNKQITNEEEESDMGNSESHDVTPVSYDKARDGVTIGRRSAGDSSVTQRGQISSQSSEVTSKNRMPDNKTNVSKQIPVNYTERLAHSESDLNEGTSICGSLKANLSLRSLYEKNSKYGYSVDDSAGLSKSIDENLQNLKDQLNKSSNENKPSLNDQSNCRLPDNQPGIKDQLNDSLHVDVLSSPDVLNYSSVLLTPPSDDENVAGKSSWNDSNSENAGAKISKIDTGVCNNDNNDHEIVSSSANLATAKDDSDVHKTKSEKSSFLPQPNQSMHDNGESVKEKSLETADLTQDDFDDSSELWKSSEKSDIFKSFSEGTTDYSGSISLEDEERDMPSPLRRAKTEKQFKQSLLHRLNDYAVGSGSSNSTSQDSTPDRSPFRRASTGCSNYSLDKSDNLSGMGTPDSDLFASCEMEDSVVEHHFEEIETELHDVEDEFEEIMSQIHHLKTLGANFSDKGEDVEELEFHPHDPLAIKACEIVEKTRHKVDMSRSRSLSPVHSVGNSFNRSSDIPDLSWDCEEMNGHMFHRNSPNKKLHSSSMTVHTLDENSVVSEHDDDDHGRTKNNSSDSKSDDYVLCSCGENDVETDCDVESFQSCGISQNSDGVASKEILQIGEKLDMLEYAVKEWKGETTTSRTMKKAYLEVPKLIHCHCLRQIRGDNYCGLRGTLFQYLSNGIKLKHWSDLDQTLNILHKVFSDNSSGLKFWNFAKRLPYNQDKLLSQMSSCISSLITKFKDASSVLNYDERVSWTVDILNTDYSDDLKLMEGLKLLMFLNIYNLYQSVQNGEDVPVFVWLLFARDTSENPASFIKNHLNCLGDSSGMEQVEMFLLGHTLGITIQVIRLLHYQQEDFISYYPDENVGVWPQVSLIAEDDRHYNVPVP